MFYIWLIDYISYIMLRVCLVLLVFNLLLTIIHLKKSKKFLTVVDMILSFIFLYGAVYFFAINHSNPHSYPTVGDIRTPVGFHRVEVEEGSFGEYMRNLQLRPSGATMMLYGGEEESDEQGYAYAVVDMDMLSDMEQCADACMRLWGEYLYKSNRLKDMDFRSVSGKKLVYTGHTRAQFEKYMNHVFAYSNTYSLENYMDSVSLSDLQIGDVLVYSARPGHKYGHAVIVADMAEDNFGNRIYIVVEGNTPARDKHVLRNFINHPLSPWFLIKKGTPDDAEIMKIPFQFTGHNIRRF